MINRNYFMSARSKGEITHNHWTYRSWFPNSKGAFFYGWKFCVEDLTGVDLETDRRRKVTEEATGKVVVTAFNRC